MSGEGSSDEETMMRLKDTCDAMDKKKGGKISAEDVV